MTRASYLSWRPGLYLRNSGVLLGWLLARAATQAALVVALSRLLGAAGYGRFVAVIAVASLVTALAGFGMGGVVLRDGARVPESLAVLMRHALRTWVWTTSISAVVAVACAWMMLPRDLPWTAVVAVVIVEVASVSFLELVGRGQQAAHRLARYGAITAGLPIARLGLLAPYAALGAPTLQGWFWLYAGASAAYSVGIALWLWPRAKVGTTSAPQLSEGAPFAVNTLAMRLQAEFNKPVLAHVGFDQTGNFSAAQRSIDIATLPLAALQEALWPRLYSQKDPRRSLRTLGALQLGVALLIGAVLWSASPWLPVLLGRDFAAASSALRMLVALPVLQAFRGLVNFHVIQRERAMAIAWAASAGAIVNVVLVAWMIPRWGAGGAALACYLTEFTMLLALFLGSRFIRGRS